MEAWKTPKHYPDVKYNLNIWTTMMMIIFSLIVYFSVLTEIHRQAANSTFSALASSPLAGGSAIILFSSFISLILIYGLEIHDKIYDKYVIKWRYKYDTEFILPELVRPFEKYIDPKFLQYSRDHIYEAMKIYYHFVADYEHEQKIKENLIVRFYEAITKYWITQINEILTIILLIFTVIYGLISIGTNYIYEDKILFFLLCLLFLLLNRIFANKWKNAVKIVTSDEIEDIHNNYLPELNSEIKKVHEKFQLIYNNDEN